jgi:transcriptional regulator with XRE-family HTH domain
MLKDGLRSAALERGLSLREIGRRLGYKQPVVLSHMAKGRVPVPIDRAPEIARQVGVPVDRFLEAVLRQHHPEVEWGLITGNPDPFLLDIEETAGKALSELSAGHHRVLREVVVDSKPEERWLSIPEIAAVKLLRELFPQLPTDGLSPSDRSTLRTCAELLKEQDDE